MFVYLVVNQSNDICNTVYDSAATAQAWIKSMKVSFPHESYYLDVRQVKTFKPKTVCTCVEPHCGIDASCNAWAQSDKPDGWIPL
jgi:hypothetical protein